MPKVRECEITRDVLKIVHEARTKALGPLSSSFHIQKLLREGLQKVLPEDAHLRVNGRLHVSLTRLNDQRNIIVNRFSSKDDLIQALLASAFIPFFSGLLPPRFHGTRYVDGALSNNLPVIDDTTITVSPLCGKSDISPDDSSSRLFHWNFSNDYIEISSQNIFRLMRVFLPPDPAQLLEICNQGFYDALRYLRTNGLISCEECLYNPFSLMDPDDLDPSDDTPLFDPQCPKCISQQKELMRAKLPDTVIQIFEDAIDLANDSLMHLVFKYKGMKVLLFISLPYTLSVDILMSITYKCAKSAVITSKNLLILSRFVTRALVQLLQDMERRQRRRWVSKVAGVQELLARNRFGSRMLRLLRHIEDRRTRLLQTALREMRQLDILQDEEFHEPSPQEEIPLPHAHELPLGQFPDEDQEQDRETKTKTEVFAGEQLKAKSQSKDSEEDSRPECDQRILAEGISTR
nr:PREDICTED: patatin-like phospholipase domain-containing protein 3 [Bemisia tabaci]